VSVDPNLFAGIASLITATGGALAAWFGSRSKVRLDDTAELKRKLDRAEAELEEKERTWEEALAHARTAHSTHVDELQSRHDADIARLQGRIDALLEQLDARDRQLTKLDRLVLVMRGYIGKLSRVVLDLGGVVPDRPREMD
jgi:flagellar motility protein MotE (MotC chaperone)